MSDGCFLGVAKESATPPPSKSDICLFPFFFGKVYDLCRMQGGIPTLAPPGKVICIIR